MEPQELKPCPFCGTRMVQHQTYFSHPEARKPCPLTSHAFGNEHRAAWNAGAASRLAIPSEPTEEMIADGCEAGGFSARNIVARKKVADIYKAMIERISNGVSE